MAENPPDAPRPADERGGLEDRSEYTPSTAHETGLSFQASPTGLGATDAPATTEGGTAARYETAQSSTNARAAWTPGAAETAVPACRYGVDRSAAPVMAGPESDIGQD